MTLRTGLSSAEAASRLARFGRNELPAARRQSGWGRFFRQFRSPLIYILLGALAVDISLWFAEGRHGTPLEAIVIAAILILNAGLGAWQESKAEAALAQLRRLAVPHAWVIRDGEPRKVPCAELVVGDVVKISAGDRVPADACIDSADNLSVDESVLTGESLPVEKSPGDAVLSGTLAVRGGARVTVENTGQASAMGKLATLLVDVEEASTPLERRLRKFGQLVARWVLTLAVVLVAGGVAFEGLDHFGRVFMFAVALAVAAVPEGLPAVLTATLALGVERMAGRKAVVRKLSAVEALGSVTVIATDKTGTLTENLMEVRDVDTCDLPRALEAMVLVNEAESAGEKGFGDPLEVALLNAAAERGIDIEQVRASFVRSSGKPFDSEWKFMRVTGALEGRDVSYLKGAPEVLLDRCKMEASDRAEWLQKAAAHAASGFRLLALATAGDDREEDLEWLGFVLLWDPPRAEVPAAIREARSAGIRVLMITGDHPSTARTIADRVGIDRGDPVTGGDLDRMTDDELRGVANSVPVFARVTPEHKLRIVSALVEAGEVVAVTGDGVNDAPALKRADVGVAMGIRGSDVSREVADLVLLDDNFATIVNAVEEGRGIYENVQKFIRHLFSTNLAEVLIVVSGVVAAMAAGLRDEAGLLLLPFTAAQLLWINLVTDGAPALALALDRTPGVMDRGPRDPEESLLDIFSLRFVVSAGLIQSLFGLSVFLLLPLFGGIGGAETRTAAFLFVGLVQLAFVYPARRTYVMPLPNKVLHAAVFFSLSAHIAAVTVPGFREVFGSVAPSAATWAWVAAAVGMSWAAAETVRSLIWGRSSGAKESRTV
jgi:Ca2+-transporting ATPase